MFILRCHAFKASNRLTSYVYRLLSDVQITDMESLNKAIQVLHEKYTIPHVIITSVKLSAVDHPDNHLCVVGSTMTSDKKARLFKILFPAIDCYFCGTGDMFGALITSRMRAAVAAMPELAGRASWLSDDNVAVTDLPLAHAAERTLASMHEVLSRTKDAMPGVIERTTATLSDEDKKDDAKLHRVKAKAAELQLVRNLDCLRSPSQAFDVIGV